MIVDGAAVDAYAVVPLTTPAVDFAGTLSLDPGSAAHCQSRVDNNIRQSMAHLNLFLPDEAISVGKLQH